MIPSVLVVDDDRGLREILEQTLAGEGYEVIAARDGLDALGCLESGLPDLVLLDWMMPGMDAPTFVAELERRDLRRQVPILLLTATNAAAERAEQIRAEAWLPKPFELARLLDQVHHLTGCGAPHR